MHKSAVNLNQSFMYGVKIKFRHIITAVIVHNYVLFRRVFTLLTCCFRSNMTDNELDDDASIIPDEGLLSIDMDGMDQSKQKDEVEGSDVLAEKSHNVDDDNQDGGNDVEADRDATADEKSDKPADKKSSKKSVATDTVYTIREYMKQISNRRRTKIQGSNNPPISFLKPRSFMPKTGRPAIYFVDGIECQNNPRLLCPGRTITLSTSSYVVIGCIWVRICIIDIGTYYLTLTIIVFWCDV